VIQSGMRILILPSVHPHLTSYYPLSSLVRCGSNFAGQIGKILGERWKNMGEKDKQVYEAKASKDKERYEAEKRAYNVSFPPPISRSLPTLCAGIA
jgi:HMG (high mobility group) box